MENVSLNLRGVYHCINILNQGCNISKTKKHSCLSVLLLCTGVKFVDYFCGLPRWHTEIIVLVCHLLCMLLRRRWWGMLGKLIKRRFNMDWNQNYCSTVFCDFVNRSPTQGPAVRLGSLPVRPSLLFHVPQRTQGCCPQQPVAGRWPPRGRPSTERRPAWPSSRMPWWST